MDRYTELGRRIGDTSWLVGVVSRDSKLHPEPRRVSVVDCWVPEPPLERS